MAIRVHMPARKGAEGTAKLARKKSIRNTRATRDTGARVSERSLKAKREGAAGVDPGEEPLKAAARAEAVAAVTVAAPLPPLVTAASVAGSCQKGKDHPRKDEDPPRPGAPAPIPYPRMRGERVNLYPPGHRNFVDLYHPEIIVEVAATAVEEVPVAVTAALAGVERARSLSVELGESSS